MVINLLAASPVKVIKLHRMQETGTISNKLIFWIIVCLLLAIVPWFF
jgi:hypothetical protein